MANELTISIGTRLAYASPGLTDTTPLVSFQTSQGTPGVVSATIPVPTADTVLDAGLTSLLADLGFAFIKNIGPSNYLEFGPESGGAIVPALKLFEGESAIMRLVPGVTYRHRANSAPVSMFIKIYDD